MPVSKTRHSLPAQGDLADHSVARVVLSLWCDGFTGRLDLTRDRVAKRVTWSEGTPLFAESNRPNETLCRQLVECERLPPSDAERVAEHVETNGGSEGAALLALRLIEPKELVTALRALLRRRLVDCFGWTAGRFDTASGEAPSDEVVALRVHPAEILHDGLAAHWSADRILADLAPHLERYPVRGPRFASVAERLPPSPERDALVEALDPTRCLGEAVHRAPGMSALASAWVLAESGAIELADQPASEAPDAAEDDAAEAAGGASPGFDIEIEVASDAANAGAGEAEEAEAAALPDRSPEAEELRKAVLERHEHLDELDHYEVLGVAADAPDAAIKKAYFGLAKRFHPDALSRGGLSDIHREANEVFARIAQAYQTLSHPTRRQAYDQKKDAGTPSAQANRVAQAETLFRKGEIMIKVGNFAGALDFLRPCVELWPEEADYQGALGWAIYKNKPSNPEKAREHLERALALKADDPITLFRLGMVLRRLGETEKGQELLDRSKAIQKEQKAAKA